MNRPSFPWATLALVALNVWVAAAVTGFVPTEASLRGLWASEATLRAGRWETLVTSLFAHGGILHLTMNMLSLLSLGIPLESNLGTIRFLLTYFGAGIAATIAQVAFVPDIPVVGASGAIFGLIGLLLALEPLVRLQVLIVEVPVVILAAVYTAFVPVLLRAASDVPIAHFAHLGGLFAGVAIAFILNPMRALRFAPGVLLVFAFTVLLVDALLGLDWAALEATPLADWVLVALFFVGLTTGLIYLGVVYRWISPRA